MKKSINEKLYLRLTAQKQEANTIGLTKVATSLSSMVEKYEPRTEDQENKFLFSSSELDSFLKDNIWNMIVKAADYYNCSVDAVQADKIAESLSKVIKAEVRNQGAVKNDIGAYEPKLPGEED